jgi:nucleotide-binding universal stress UspA family protein
MYRTIVVGVDGSEASDDAVALAQQLLDRDAGKLILAAVFHLYHGFAHPMTSYVYADWLREQGSVNLDRACALLDEGVRHERRLLADSSVPGALNDLAERVEADLIVLGSTHHGTAGRIGGRTVVQRLLHGAPCAVAVAAAKQADRFAAGARIVVAYDGSAESQVALEAAFALAEGTGASVVLCHVIEPVVFPPTYVPVPPDLAAETAREEVVRGELAAAASHAPRGVTVEQRIVRGAPAWALLEHVGPEADLVIAGSRHYGMLRRALAGSVASSLLAHGDVPVLVTPRAGVHREPPTAPASTEEPAVL